MTYTDYAAQARSYAATAAAATRRARRDAKLAEDAYRAAADRRQLAAWLTVRPGFWDLALSTTPADADAAAATWTRIGDTYLQGSFASTDNARFYRDLAARYRVLAARYPAPDPGPGAGAADDIGAAFRAAMILTAQDDLDDTPEGN